MTTPVEPARAPIEATDLRFLEPGELRFSRHGVRLRLTLKGDCSYLDTRRRQPGLAAAVYLTSDRILPLRFLFVSAGARNKQ